MLLNYKECIEKYGSDYKLKKEISIGNIFMKEKGIYSTSRNVSDVEIIMRKYHRSVFTYRSAFYYHSLTDVIPDYFYLATVREDTRIRDQRVKQSFVKNEIFDAGIEYMKYNNMIIRIYNKERMLVELMRFKSKVSFDYYKEIIQSYRGLIDNMDFGIVEDYAYMFRNGENIMNQIQMEVL